MIFGDLILKLLFLVQRYRSLGEYLSSLSLHFHILHWPRLEAHTLGSHQQGCGQHPGSSLQGNPSDDIYLGSHNIVGSAWCKLVYYIHRTARGLSLCTTCLLSNFQAITVSPRTGGSMGLKDSLEEHPFLLLPMFDLQPADKTPLFLSI